MSVHGLTATFIWSILTGTVAAVDPIPATSGGLDLTGIALIISALAALVTAIGGFILGIRRTSGDEIDAELRRLLKEKLAAELEDEEPP